jgi:hypothetical protein
LQISANATSNEHARPKKKPSSVKADLCNLKNHILSALGRLCSALLGRRTSRALGPRAARLNGEANDLDQDTGHEDHHRSAKQAFRPEPRGLV